MSNLKEGLLLLGILVGSGIVTGLCWYAYEVQLAKQLGCQCQCQCKGVDLEGQ